MAVSSYDGLTTTFLIMILPSINSLVDTRSPSILALHGPTTLELRPSWENNFVSRKRFAPQGQSARTPSPVMSCVANASSTIPFRLSPSSSYKDCSPILLRFRSFRAGATCLSPFDTLDCTPPSARRSNREFQAVFPEIFLRPLLQSLNNPLASCPIPLRRRPHFLPRSDDRSRGGGLPWLMAGAMLVRRLDLFVSEHEAPGRHFPPTIPVLRPLFL